MDLTRTLRRCTATYDTGDRVERKRRVGVLLGPQRRVLAQISIEQLSGMEILTFRLWAVHVDTSTTDEYVVDDGEDAFAADPVAMLVLYAAIIQHGSLIEFYASAMNSLCKWNFLRVEIVPTRSAYDILGTVIKDIADGC